MKGRILLAAATMLLPLAACSLRSSPPSFPEAPPPGAPSGAGSAQPPPTAPAQPPPTAPSRPPPKQYHLGPASSALAAQAHKQMSSGDLALAAATIERAMRIEPDNPLLWIELGRIRYTAGDASQAESMGRKALALSTGDPQAQSSSWHLIADSLRALGRNPEAADADKRANALAPR
jgi:predicted Zn-dependent protease